VARLSPGFLPADLVTLVSTAEMAAARNGGGDAASASPTERTLLLLLHMRAAVHTVRPTLLTGAGTSWSPIEWRDDGGAGGMFGVASQVDALASCVRAMFRGGADSERVEGRERSPGRVLDALGAVAGVVLYGPPGSGKTSLACAATSFLPRGAVNGFVLNSAEVVGAVVGAAEQKLRALFALARATAPAVLVLENIEVLAPSRRLCEEEGAEVGSSSAAAFQRLLSTFLVELDGIAKGEGSGGGIVLLVATTSDIGRIDSALLRPGRLEVHIEMEYPDEDARVEILSSHLSRVAPHLCESSWLRSFAQATHGRSAPDLQGVCTEAVMLKLRESNMTCSNGGTIEPLCLEHRHLLRALSATSWTP
jgi:SpoVK/Ycf46/Vps4 family AAA+-type ATPase